MATKLLNVVIDTNVIVSGIGFGGIPHQILSQAYKEQITLVTTDILLSELTEVLVKKLKYPPERVTQITRQLRGLAKVVFPDKTINTCRHPADNRVLEAAVAGECDYIISGDQDLLTLKKHSSISILTPAQFLNLPP